MATDSIAERTAQIIAQAMVNAGTTRQALAEASGIPYTTLGRKLRGVTPFDLVEVCNVARALKVRPADLLPADITATSAA